MMNAPHIPPEDPRLTAYALGELEADECASVEAALLADPVARQRVAEIRATAARLEAILRAEPAAVAPQTARVEAARAPAQGSVRYPARGAGRGRIIRFPQFYYLVSGAAAAAFALLILWQRPEQVAKERMDALYLQLAQERRARAITEAINDALRERLALQEAQAKAASDAPATTDGEVTFAPGFAVATVSGNPDPALPPAPEASRPAFRPGGEFFEVRRHPQSTFPIDISPASYAGVRHLLREGRLPPAGMVRIEEWLNYFPYRLPAPPAGEADAGNTPAFAAALEVAEAPWAPAHRLVRIGLRGREIAAASRPAANLVFLIEVSDSMSDPNRLPLVQDSLRFLIGQLGAGDRVAIITYAGTAKVVLPPTPGSQPDEIRAAIAGLEPVPSSDGAGGLRLAYDLARAHYVAEGVNRVVFCTAGDFHPGPTEAAALLQLVAAQADSGVALSVLGFGPGEHRDPAMAVLAARGKGVHASIESVREGQKVLAEQVHGSPAAIARDVTLQVEFNPAKVAGYRLIGFDDQASAGGEWREDSVASLEVAAGQAVTALYEIVPVGAEEAGGGRRPDQDELRYQAKAAGAGLPPVVEDELLTLTVRYREALSDEARKLEFPLTDSGARFGAASADFKFAAAVAQFGQLLRKSPHAGIGTIRDVIEWAAAGSREGEDDPGGFRREFVGLARRAQELWR